MNIWNNFESVEIMFIKNNKDRINDIVSKKYIHWNC